MKREASRPDPGPFETGFWRSHWKEAALLLAFVFALYGTSIRYEFVLDDQMVVTKNAYTRLGLAGIPRILTTDSFQGYLGEQARLVSGGRYRPLSLVTFAVEHSIFGQSSRVSHLVGIVLYALTALLIFRVTSLLFDDEARGSWFVSIAFLTGVLYVVHPVHSEVVANIKGRDEILAMLGALGALYGVLRYLGEESRLWWALSGLSLFLGLLAKENAITWLVVIPLVLFFFYRVDRRRLGLAMIPAVAAAATYLLIRWRVLGPLFHDEGRITDLLNNPFIDMSLAERYATIFYTLGLYLKLLFIPYPLTHDYYPYHIPIMHWGRVASLLSLALYLGLIAYALFAARTKQVGAFCVLYFVVTLSVVSNLLFPVGTFMSERFLYMPSLAYCIAVAYLLAAWLLPRSRLAGTAVALVLVLGLTSITVGRVPAWASPLGLARADAKVSHNSAKANCSLAITAYDVATQTDDPAAKKPLLDEAESHVERSLAIFPTYRVAIQVKSALLAEQYALDGDLDRLLLGFEDVLRRDPDVEYVQRYAEYLKSLALDRRRLVEFYFRVGYEILALDKRRYDLALKYLGFGLELDRGNARIHWALGRTYDLRGEPAKARAFLARAHQLDPALDEN